MASIVNQAATSTLPIGLDNIKSPAVLKDIAVRFFNDSTVSCGSIQARASVLVTANHAFCDTKRIMCTLACIHLLNTIILLLDVVFQKCLTPAPHTICHSKRKCQQSK